MAFCRKCGNQLGDGSKFCMACGTPVNRTDTSENSNAYSKGPETEKINQTQSQYICKSCGNPVRQGLKFCTFCGAPVTNNNVNSGQQQYSGPSRTDRDNFPPSNYPPQNHPQNNNAFQTNQNKPSSGYSSTQPDGKKSNTALIVSIVVGAVVLVAAIVVAAIFLLPDLLSGNTSAGNNAGASSSQSSQASSALSETPTAPATVPTESATQPPTEAETETETAPDNLQRIEVVSSDSKEGDAKLTLYEWRNGKWTSLMSADAYVGKYGVSTDYGEGKNITPQGEYKIGFCYGLSKPSTNLRFKQVNSNSVFVDDSSSKYYNCLVTTNEYKGARCENTYAQFTTKHYYNYNIFIEHNGDGETPGLAEAGKGSVITICGKTGALTPTAGCIDISSTDMVTLLSYLDSSKNPIIEISQR